MRRDRLGYGSHAFLNEYILRNRCRKIMEIGVANGENARAMITVASRNFPSEEVEYYGFDTFEAEDESQMKLVRKKLEKTGCQFKLFKGNSVATLPKALKDLPMMDLIFIDGGHSYETVKSDWENSKALMQDKTAVFFHNYDFTGVKKAVDGIFREEYLVEIIHPPADYDTALVKKKT
jgi:predicted O-methyltransferase YrrM